MIETIRNLDWFEITIFSVIALTIGFVLLLIVSCIFDAIYYTYRDEETVIVKMKVDKRYSETNTTYHYNSSTKTHTPIRTTNYYVKVSGEGENFTIQSGSLYSNTRVDDSVLVTYAKVFRAKRFEEPRRYQFYSKSIRNYERVK